MAVSNLKVALTRKYKDWRGEKILLEKQIADITAAYQTLGEKRERAHVVDRLIHSVEIIMAEIVPDWDPATATPTRKGATKLPFEAASVMRWTFDILRQADEPLRSRAIAERIMEMNERSLDDKDLTDRIREAVDSALRSKLKKGLVDSVDQWPVRWFIKNLEDGPEG